MASYRAPSADEVQSALLQIPTSQLRRVFYEGLENPLWVRPLLVADAFANPPEPENSDDGYVRDIYWPEISYLARVAPIVPSDVVDVLRTFEETNNAWIKRAVFEIGPEIPASEGARLKPLLEAWTTSGFGWRTDPRQMVSFAIALLEGGERKVGRWLANYLFCARPPITEELFRRRPETTLDDYWYQEELPRLVPALDGDALKAVCGWLATYAKHAGYADPEHDHSGMLRVSISTRDTDYPSPEHALVDAVRDLALSTMMADPEGTAAILLAPGVQILRKIAMHVVAVAIRDGVDRRVDVPGLSGIARRLLADEASDHEHLLVEYVELAQAVATLDPSVLDVLNEFVAFAYAEDIKWMRKAYVDEQTPEDEARAQVERRADRYKQRLLSAIGVEALPPPLKAELARLDERDGPVEGKLTPSGMVSTWSGPNPHSTQDEMAAMSAEDLLALLASWHDAGDGWGPEPSHEGQGRELAELLTTNPNALSGASDLATQLRPTYLRAILQGWQSALKADLALDWSEVAELVRDVLAHSHESSFPVEGGDMDDDVDYQWAKKAAVDLLVELVKKRDNVSIPNSVLQVYADLLIEGADDGTAWALYEEHQPRGSGWDPLTMSLNWQWPSRIRGLIRLATREPNAAWSAKALSAVEMELKRVDSHGAAWAVLGESLGYLIAEEPGWLDRHAQVLFGSANGLSEQQQVALTTAVATHYYHRHLYDVLAGPMIAAITIGDDLVRGWRNDSDPVERIGEWVIAALIHGHVTIEDPVFAEFFSSASPRVRGAALGSTAWSFFQAHTVNATIRDRFAALWDQRAAHVKDHPEHREELSGALWLAKGGKFPVKWWLPKLREALEANPSIATERYMIGKELAHASAIEPGGALAVLKLLLASRDEAGMVSFDLTTNAVPFIIARAMSGDDPVLRVEAEAYMNELGAKGYIDLEAQVQSVLDGAITDDQLGD